MPTYTIIQIAEEFNLTLRTLRFWESRGLIAPAKSGTTRIYTENNRLAVARIVHWRQQQFTIEEIKAALAAGGFTTEAKLGQLEHLEATLKEIEAAIADLQGELEPESANASSAIAQRSLRSGRGGQ